MENKQYIKVKFSKELEKVNSDFLKCTVSLVTSEQVANGTKFTDISIENARASLDYCPVIGWFKKNSDGEDDFSNHGIEYVINDEGIEEICHTVPFGVILPNTSRYEIISDFENGSKKYLVADCYIWKRYDKAVKVLQENRCNQSVEVEINSYSNGRDCGYTTIDDFKFKGVCILSENCQPAFALAKIRTSDRFAKDDFKIHYEEMTNALSKFLKSEEGNDIVENKEETVIEEETVVEKEIIVKEETIDPIVEEVVVEEEKDDKEDFEAKYNEVIKELEKVKAEYVDLQTKFSEKEELYNALEVKVNELEQFKADIEKAEFEKAEFERKKAIDEKLEQYEELSKLEGYKLIVNDDVYNCDFEMTELKLKALAYDNGIILNRKKNFSKKENTKVTIINNAKNEQVNETWSILDKYLK